MRNRKDSDLFALDITRDLFCASQCAHDDIFELAWRQVFENAAHARDKRTFVPLGNHESNARKTIHGARLQLATGACLVWNEDAPEFLRNRLPNKVRVGLLDRQIISPLVHKVERWGTDRRSQARNIGLEAAMRECLNASQQAFAICVDLLVTAKYRRTHRQNLQFPQGPVGTQAEVGPVVGFRFLKPFL